MAAEIGIEIQQTDGPPIDELQILVSRLDYGERLIERTRAAGRDISKLEEHWIELLAEYEALFDSRRQRAA